ncbi:YqcI/YcgG family-domain-containing protein [Usnea florida]
MLLALSALSFSFGFVLAAIANPRPKEARDAYFSLKDSLRNLRHLVDAVFNPSAPSGRNPSSAAGENNHAIPTDDANLLTKAQCEKLPEETWQRQAYEALKSILLARNEGAKRFPCIYATSGYNHDEHRYIFMHSDDPSEPRNLRLLASAMRAYLPQSHSIGPNTSLVIIHPPASDTNTDCPSPSVDSYHHKFWTLLRGLRTCDLKPWPSDIPPRTDDAKWAFCFDGVPWFPAAMTPAHEHRLSRHAPFFTVAMQPKWVFDNLFRTPERRRAAVEKVRTLMPAFDEVDLSPDLSAYGTEGTTEAHQYYLLDENRTSFCPFEDLDR